MKLSWRKGLITLIAGLMFIVVFGCGTKNGPDAIKRMSDADKTFLETKLQKVQFKMTERQVVELLGPPTKIVRIPGQDGSRHEWIAPGGNPFSRCYVYFDESGAFNVRWLKVFSFLWESHLWEASSEKDSTAVGKANTNGTQQ